MLSRSIPVLLVLAGAGLVLGCDGGDARDAGVNVTCSTVGNGQSPSCSVDASEPGRWLFNCHGATTTEQGQQARLLGCIAPVPDLDAGANATAWCCPMF